MPDPRFEGHRIIPGMGNSSNLVENVWGFSMAAEVDRDPAFAGWLRFMNRLCNGNVPLERGPNYHDHVNATPHALYYLPYVPEHPQPLATAFLPTYGVVFRHQFNTPNETALLLRAGLNWGHWDTDALNVILYGQGAPLSPGTGYQYYSGPATENNAIYHNQVKLGRRNVRSVSAAWTRRSRTTGSDRTPITPWPRDSIRRRFRRRPGATSWNRHVLFVKTEQPKGPSYFVMRDTFAGPAARRSWWEWLNLDTADLIRVGTTAFDPAKTPMDKVVPEDRSISRTGSGNEDQARHLDLVLVQRAA